VTALALQDSGRGTEVLVPRSFAEAVAAFGDGAGITVVGGGTVLTPLLQHGLIWPERALMLHAAGLDQIAEGDPLEVGAYVSLGALAKVAPEPVASAARIPDYEIRHQATVAGNLIVAGDLQAALLVCGALVRSGGQGGEREDDIETFIASTRQRLVLSVKISRPLAGIFVQQRRRHSHTHPVLTVAVAQWGDGVRVAVGALGERAPAVRCPSVEIALSHGATPAQAAAAVVDDVQAQDDPLASAWYRRRTLPVLVERALRQLEEAH
jgi:CO/xanthine dehydrogenase FAD-binding subunit